MASQEVVVSSGYGMEGDVVVRMTDISFSYQSKPLFSGLDLEPTFLTL